MFEELQCIKSGTSQLVRKGSQKPCGHGPAGAVIHSFSVYLLTISPHTVLQTLLSFTLTTLSASVSSFITISSGFQPAILSYLFTLSKHKLSHLDLLCGLVPLCAAACFASRSVSKVTLLLHRHFASKGSPAQHHYLEMDMMEAAWWAAVNKHLPSIFTGP